MAVAPPVGTFAELHIPITAETIHVWNAAHAGLVLTPAREAELTVELKQLAAAIAIPATGIVATNGKRSRAHLGMVVSLTSNSKVVKRLHLPSASLPCGITADGLRWACN